MELFFGFGYLPASQAHSIYLLLLLLRCVPRGGKLGDRSMSRVPWKPAVIKVVQCRPILHELNTRTTPTRTECGHLH